MLTSLSVYTDLTAFITNAKPLAQAIVDFSNIVTGSEDSTGVNLNAITTAEQASTLISAMMKSAGVYADITEFINNAEKLATAIVQFSSTVSGGVINIEAITAATDAGHKIVGVINSSAVYTDTSSFIENAGSVAKSIADFSQNVSDGIDVSALAC